MRLILWRNRARLTEQRVLKPSAKKTMPLGKPPSQLGAASAANKLDKSKQDVYKYKQHQH